MAKLEAIREKYWKHYIRFAQANFFEKQNQPEGWDEAEDDIRQLIAVANDFVRLFTHVSELEEQIKILSINLETDASAVTLAQAEICAEFMEMMIWYIHRRHLNQETYAWLLTALLAAKKTDDAYRIGLFSSELGVWHNIFGRPEDALTYFQQSLELNRLRQDSVNEAYTLANLAAVLSRMEQPQEALAHCHLALELFRQAEDSSGEALVMNTIGSIQDGLGQQEALEAYLQALELQRKNADRSGEAITLSNIGFYYTQLENHESALEYYRQALPLMELLGNVNGKARTLQNIGLSYDYAENYDQALNYYLQALEIYRQINDLHGLSETEYSLGMLKWKDSEHETGLEHFQKALHCKRFLGLNTAIDEQRLAARQLMFRLGIFDYDEFAQLMKEFQESFLENSEEPS